MMANRILALGLLCALLAPNLALALSYDEAVSGDLSGDRTAPTSFTLGSGVNSLSGSTAQGDLDYVTIFAPGPIVSLVLGSYASTNDVAFIGLQSGTTFTEPNVGADPSHLL